MPKVRVVESRIWRGSGGFGRGGKGLVRFSDPTAMSLYLSSSGSRQAGSSFLTLLIRLEMGRVLIRSAGYGANNACAIAGLPDVSSHASKSLGSMMTGMRSWMDSSRSLAIVVTIVQLSTR